MSIATIVATDPLARGAQGEGVLALQMALTAAGYRVSADKQFGPRTEMVVRQFQQQHGLPIDGVVGAATAAAVDAPHETLVATAKPLTNIATGWPHDDTASLLAFYGKPWEDKSLLVTVAVPFEMTYRQDAHTLLHIPRITIHRKCADALGKALGMIAAAAQGKPEVLRRVSQFSGSYNYRPVRGSSRLSCHAFGAALDFDAGELPLGKTGVTAADMPAEVIAAFDAAGFFWGGRYTGRKDPMHVQAAHE